MTAYTIRPLDADEVQTAIDWAAAEGWNPGHNDAACFRSQDPKGFWGGFPDGEMIGSISVVNYGPHFAFLGFYIIQPKYRGRGFGLQLWQKAIAHAEGRNIGLDGVVEQQGNYRKSGFTLAYRNIRHGGSVQAAFSALPKLENRLTPEPVRHDDDIVPYDRTLFPAPRPEFLHSWTTAPGHVTRVARDGDRITGYATLRPCRSGYKVGPLFADDTQTATTVLRAVLETLGPEAHGDELFLDTPEPNGSAVRLARDLGLSPVFETARMYTKNAPQIDLSRIYGVTTFELG